MAFDFTNFITSSVVAANFNARKASQANYLHSALFPHKAKASIDLAFIKGSKGLPVTLKPSAFDAKATFRDRLPVKELKMQMPFFREGYKISEKDKIEFARGNDATDPFIKETLNFIFDDTADLIAGARVVPERMVMQLLFPENGNIGIAIKANGVDYTYNYDTDGSWKTNNFFTLSNSDKWDSPSTSDPIQIFETVKGDIASKTGAVLNLAIMNTATYQKMASSAAILARANRNNAQTAYATRTEVEAVVRDFVSTDIIVYDGKYRDEDGAVKDFIPDGYVAYVPNDGTALGGTWFAQTPEMIDANNFGGADVAVVDEGISIITYTDEHPVNTNIIASEIVLPSYERMDECACIKVF